MRVMLAYLEASLRSVAGLDSSRRVGCSLLRGLPRLSVRRVASAAKDQIAIVACATRSRSRGHRGRSGNAQCRTVARGTVTALVMWRNVPAHPYRDFLMPYC
jgi:hypothetical protein